MADGAKKVSPWNFAQMPHLGEKTIVVTGGTSGIGLAACRRFVAAGARVIMSARNTAAGVDAARTIVKEVPGARIEVLELDLGDLASVHRFSKEVLLRSDRIDVLCNNAGVMAVRYPRRKYTANGFELHLGVNHLGHFALTGLLMDRLQESAPARVVTQTSRAHKGQKTLDVNNLALIGDCRHAYGISKLANVLFSEELARRTDALGVGIASIGCHPGIAKTNLVAAGATAAGVRAPWWLRLAYGPAPSPDEGALALIYAAVGLDINNGDFVGPSGPMESRGKPHKTQPSAVALDEGLARALWTKSESLTGVRFLDVSDSSTSS